MIACAAAWRPVSPAVLTVKMSRPLSEPARCAATVAASAAASEPFCSEMPRPRTALPAGVSMSSPAKGFFIAAAGCVIA